MHIPLVETIRIYKCLGDTQRLRILNLLKDGPLCVCHLIEILDIDQVKASKQLRYMKELGIVRAVREAQWMIYSLAEPISPLLIENLKCLLDCATSELPLAADLEKRANLLSRIQEGDEACPLPVSTQTMHPSGC